ncbi:unnamed protein product [[Candida] boidinii]|uniref:Putative lipase ATG15 n=1 Tax=Candida boidinii TaxID=5477 RepID=A0A9W6STW1_CANBO|nr:unnamed protein product [[Candida] boidinii]GMF99098.1 unnamed protein product [[Candida] boidinii]
MTEENDEMTHLLKKQMNSNSNNHQMSYDTTINNKENKYTNNNNTNNHTHIFKKLRHLLHIKRHHTFWIHFLIFLSLIYIFINKFNNNDSNITSEFKTDNINNNSNNNNDNLGNQNGPVTNTFKIRHIFHNNPGKVHARLDITPELIRSFQLDSVAGINRKPDLLTQDDESQYETANNILNNDRSWPKQFDTQSPWTYNYNLKSYNDKITRLQNRSPEFIESYLNYAFEVGSNEIQKINLDWVLDDITFPNVTDKFTLVNLALMASNAYVDVPRTGDWKEVDGKFNETMGYGWLSDGIRGHIFTDDLNTTLIIAIKGTSAAGLNSGPDTETSEKDKINDNLLFSCCCARVSYLWSTVCDCYEGSYTCNQNCLEKEMRRQDRYYQATLELYKNITSLYPDIKNIWITGHSLGGGLSSLLARTYGLPAVTFEAPGELLATKRLHLPSPPGIPIRNEHIWHFGHTADPIYMGVCNGASSTCAIAGYAMETQCHSGMKCVYDVVNDLGWHVSLLNHRIHTVIDNIILAYNDTAKCFVPPNCHDCFDWQYTDHHSPIPKLSPHDSLSPSETVTSTTTTTSLTKTSKLAGTSPTGVLPTRIPGERKCLKRTWYGKCYEWEDPPKKY